MNSSKKKKIIFPYGEKSLEINIPNEIKNIDTLIMGKKDIIKDPIKRIYDSFKNPLRSKSLTKILTNRKSGKIIIVVSDITRTAPNKIFLASLIKLFDKLKIPDDQIQILIANGLHRKNNPKEIKALLGKEVMFRFDILNHDAADVKSLDYIGESSHKTPIYINKTYLEASVKIITGEIKPHFFAGYSGGHKSIVPGISGKATIMANHSFNKIHSKNSRFGILKNNPVYEDALEIVKLKEINPDFLINVIQNSDHRITDIIVGNLQSYFTLIQKLKNYCFSQISKKYDVVLVGNGGYPADINLYQAVKSMALGELAIKEGGTIIAINECRNGVGHPKFKEMIDMNISPKDLYDKIRNGVITTPDQWEIQVLTRILSFCNVRIISSLTKDDLGNIGLIYNESVEEAIMECKRKYGPEMGVLILPDGENIIPKL